MASLLRSQLQNTYLWFSKCGTLVAELCSIIRNVPINVMPHYLPIGQLMGIIWRGRGGGGGGGGGGGMTEGNAPIVGCIVEVKSKFPVISHLFQGDLITGFALL